ncbi:MAG: SlyX family protein [Thermodesulfobacteriota bacterium]|jgi:SlyX protein
MEERLIELETRLAFQEKTLEELNEVVTRQQEEIDRLGEEVGRLTARLRPLLAAAEADGFPEA